MTCTEQDAVADQAVLYSVLTGVFGLPLIILALLMFAAELIAYLWFPDSEQEEDEDLNGCG